MKTHALIALIRAKYREIPERQKPLALVLVGLLGILVFVLLVNIFLAITSLKAKLPPEPLMIRQGKQITIPLHSPLRSELKIQAVGTLTLPHIVSVPGLVEADPRYTVNIMPPLTGRLIKLQVRLGDSVKKNQVLAVISSPDLAQA